MKASIHKLEVKPSVIMESSATVASTSNLPPADIRVSSTGVLSVCRKQRTRLEGTIIRKECSYEDLKRCLEWNEHKLQLARRPETPDPGPLIRRLRKTIKGLNWEIGKNERTRSDLQKGLDALDRRILGLEQAHGNHRTGSLAPNAPSPADRGVDSSRSGLTIDPDIANAFEDLNIGSNGAPYSGSNYTSFPLQYSPYTPYSAYSPYSPMYGYPGYMVSPPICNWNAQAPWGQFNQSLAPSWQRFSPQISPLTQLPHAWYQIPPHDANMQINEPDGEAFSFSTGHAKLEENQMDMDEEEEQGQKQLPVSQDGAPFAPRLSSMGNRSAAARSTGEPRRRQHSI